MASDLETLLAEKLQQITDRFNAGLFRELPEFYSEDCQLVLAGKDIMNGQQALTQELQERAKAPPKTYKVDIKTFHASPDGALAYQVLRIHVLARDGTIANTINTLMMWKKVNGDYKVCLDMSN